MGLFDFAINAISATVKVAITPVAVVKDVVNVVVGEEPDATKELLQSAAKDANDAVDEMMP